MNKFRSGDGKPVVALDIDGTLGDYHAHFLWFAEKWLGMKMPSATDVNSGMRLSEFMRIPHGLYRECKLAYRQGGIKRFMPAYPFAKELTYNIIKAGAEVWLCTTRPYLRLDNIDPDTREWLKRNHISYSAVIFDSLEELDSYETKYYDLVRQVGVDRVVAAVDDLPHQIAHATYAGIGKVYLRNQPYNGGTTTSYTARANSLEQLWEWLDIDIQQWKEAHA
jgi:hypothetical protein